MGTLGRNLRRPITDVTDGTSNTFLLVEDAGRDQHWVMGRYMGQKFVEKGEGGAWANYGGGSHMQIWGWNTATNARGGTCMVNCANGDGIYVFHIGGANVVLCDGSVHFLNSSTPIGIVVALTTRSGGEVFSFSNYLN